MLHAFTGLLAAALLTAASATAQSGPSLALAPVPSRESPPAPAPAEAWYSCSGSFLVESDGQKWEFGNLLLQKIDGESFELRGTGKDSTTPALSLFIKTFNPALILRQGLTYVSEGNLEAGETFTLALRGAAPATALVSKPAGCVMRVASVRGSAVKGDVKGSFQTAAGPKPYIASFDLIDARYGQ